jgi:hypothetical protein
MTAVTVGDVVTLGCGEPPRRHALDDMHVGYSLPRIDHASSRRIFGCSVSWNPDLQLDGTTHIPSAR